MDYDTITNHYKMMFNNDLKTKILNLTIRINFKSSKFGPIVYFNNQLNAISERYKLKLQKEYIAKFVNNSISLSSYVPNKLSDYIYENRLILLPDPSENRYKLKTSVRVPLDMFKCLSTTEERLRTLLAVYILELDKDFKTVLDPTKATIVSIHNFIKDPNSINYSVILHEMATGKTIDYSTVIDKYNLIKSRLFLPPYLILDHVKSDIELLITEYCN